MTSPTGQYRFDFVIPGTYTVSAEISGFRTFVQKNVLVEALGDVTVNIALQPHDEPGRLVADAAGHVHVILRRGTQILLLRWPR